MQYLNHQLSLQILEDDAQQSEWDVSTNQLCLLQYFSWTFPVIVTLSTTPPVTVIGNDCATLWSTVSTLSVPAEPGTTTFTVKSGKKPHQFQGNIFSDDRVLIQQALYIVYIQVSCFHFFSSNHLRSTLLQLFTCSLILLERGKV